MKNIMLTEYIDESLRRANYEIIDDEEPFYGEIKELKGETAPPEPDASA